MRILALMVAVLLSCGELIAQCNQLSITTQSKVLCAPAKVQFVLHNLPPYSSVKWDLGNGQINGSDTIYEFFVDPKVILPKATVNLPGAGGCIVKAKDSVFIKGKPEPDFSVSRTKLCDGPDSVTLVNKTPNTVSVNWIVDGSNYAEADDALIHHFMTSGKKAVSLVVFDSYGCRGIVTRDEVVEVLDDVQVDFNADIKTGCAPQQVKLTSEIRDHGESIIAYMWDLKGSESISSTEKDPAPLDYLNGGEFNVGLSVKTDKGCTHQFSKKKYLRFADNNELNITLSDTFLCNKEVARIDLNDWGGYKVDWTISGAQFKMRSDSTVRVAFPEPGYYDIGIKAEKNGCINERIYKDTIHAEWVSSYFASNDYYHCQVPHTTHYRQVSTSSMRGQMDYLWQIYDGDSLIHSSTAASDSTTFMDWGKYSINLITEHPNGCADTLNRTEFIRVDSIRPRFIAKPDIACVDQIIEVESRTPPSSFISADSFEWIFYKKNKTDVIARKKGKTVEISYGDTGTYDIQLIAANSIGCRDTLRVEDAVEVIIPELDFKISSPVICSGNSTTFHGLTRPARANFRHFWSMQHEDGQVIMDEQEGSNITSFNGPPGNYIFKYTHKIEEGCIDSFAHSDTLKVNGIKSSVALDSNSACTPFVISPTVVIEKNYHFGNTDRKITHEWTSEPSNGVTIENSDRAQPTFTFHQRGVYRIRLVVINSSGCRDTSYSEDINAGILAASSLSTDSVCVGAPVQLYDHSFFKHTSAKWYVEGPGKGIISKDSIPELKVTARGEYRVYLVAGKHGKCFDTSSTRLLGIDVQSDFTVVDTQLFCAPAYAQFEAKAIDADTFLWDFGDGHQAISTSTEVANIYQRNSGWFKGMDVTMVAKSSKGCTDTVSKPGAVRIIGPVPKFNMENIRGCAPLEVVFENRSDDVAKFYMNYNDGEPLDSINLGTHLYNIKNSKDIQVFNPSLYVLDALGCAAMYKPQDSIVVLRSPEVMLDSIPELTCFPNEFATCDLSKDIESRKWSVNGEYLGGDKSISYTRTSNSVDTVVLEVKNHLGCTDIAEEISIYRHPEKLQLTIDKEACLNKPIAININGANVGDFSKLKWELNGTVIDTGFISSFSPDRYGINELKLSARDPFTCPTGTESGTFVINPNDIPEGVVERVSFNEENRLEIFWGEVNPTHLVESIVRESGTGQTVDRFPVNSSEYLLMPLIPVDNVPCVELVHIDNCQNEGEARIEHCPVILHVESNKAFTNSLTWPAYRGWNDVTGYRIYRMKSDGEYELLDEVDGSVLSYTDEDLCELKFTYLVEAYNEDLKSRSNSAASTPLYTHLIQDLSLERATVVNDEYVNVIWPKNCEPSFWKYGLTIRDGSGAIVDEIELIDTSYDHTDARVSEMNYIYEIRSIDHCGLENKDGLPGSSILLTASLMNREVNLEWTPYHQWKNEVEEYVIEILDEGSFREVTRVPGEVLQYIDAESHEGINGKYTYRVRAIKRGATHINSLSNTATVIGNSSVWIPNAFSPNRDNLNETFKPKMQFVQQITDGGKYIYELNVYNRWGEKLFSTKDQTEGWNGYYLGKKAPMGSYLYTVRVSGLDKVPYNLSGQVFVLE